MADSRTVTAGDVERALEALGPEVAEGTVGAGTGMDCYGYPGGIGTASRLVDGYTVGVLLLCNFGDRDYLDVLEGLPAPDARPGREGSCIAVCMTDAPLAPHQLRRLALRPLLGLARTGSYAHEGSGEIGLALSTSLTASLDNSALNPYFAGAYEAAQEAVYNCLVAGARRPSASTARCRKSFRSISSAGPGRAPAMDSSSSRPGLALLAASLALFRLALLDGVVRRPAG